MRIQELEIKDEESATPVEHPEGTRFNWAGKKAPQYDLPDLPQYHLPELQGRRGKQNTQNKDRYKARVVGGEVAQF